MLRRHIHLTLNPHTPVAKRLRHAYQYHPCVQPTMDWTAHQHGPKQQHGRCHLVVAHFRAALHQLHMRLHRLRQVSKCLTLLSSFRLSKRRHQSTYWQCLGAELAMMHQMLACMVGHSVFARNQLFFRLGYIWAIDPSKGPRDICPSQGPRQPCNLGAQSGNPGTLARYLYTEWTTAGLYCSRSMQWATAGRLGLYVPPQPRIDRHSDASSQRI